MGHQQGPQLADTGRVDQGRPWRSSLPVGSRAESGAGDVDPAWAEDRRESAVRWRKCRVVGREDADVSERLDQEVYWEGSERGQGVHVLLSQRGGSRCE